MDILPFISKYIPKQLDDIIGNNENTKYISQYIKKKLRSNIIVNGPCGTGKTTMVKVLINELKITSDYLLSLNMSDIRGIDIVDTKINNFLDKKCSNDIVYTIILDEVDNLTIRAQYSIRELIEKHNTKCRFIFICNNISNIIENIQSKCKILKYNKLQNEDIIELIKRISKKEKIKPTKDGLESIAFISNGDVRVALNYLQEIVVVYPDFTKDNVYEVCDYPPPEIIKNVLDKCKENNLIEVIKDVNEVYSLGYSFFDLINILFKILKTYPVSEEQRLEMIKELGYGHVRNASGSQSNLQLLRLFALFTKIMNSNNFLEKSCK